MMKVPVHYITLGCECSPAAALKDLELRKFALPFDWVQTNIHTLIHGITDQLSKYHCDLHLNHNKQRVIDSYGFEFPHDYPTQKNDVGIDVSGEQLWTETTIVDHWMDFYESVKDKYDRRIQRFNEMMQDTIPIVVLCRYNTHDVLALQQFLESHYKRNDLYFVNSCSQSFQTEKIINVYTEQNGVWNETSLWRTALDVILQHIDENHS